MKLLTLTTAALLAMSVAMPTFAQEATTETPNDEASDAAMGADSLGIDVMATGTTDEERMAFFMAMAETDRTAMVDKCTTYLGRDESQTPNEEAEVAAMTFCKVVIAPQ